MKHLARVTIIGLLGISLAGCGNNVASTQDTNVPDGWPSSGLAKMIPAPSGEVSSVKIDDESLGAEIACSIDEFNDYIDACKDSGYTIDEERESSSFGAYSEEGYLVSLQYWDFSETMNIDLSAPVDLSEIAWPTIGAGSLVPVPASNMGQISSDKETFFFAHIGETDQDAFQEYVNACIEAGYTVDYNKGDTWYYADNTQSVHLSLKYVGFNTMTVRVDSSELTADDQSEAADNGAVDTDSTSSDASGVSTDFKATMDGYEAFFDEYAAFMKAYAENPTSTDLMARYEGMLTQYTETMNSLNTVDTASLSEADYAYYLEVSARIFEKMASAAV